MLLKDKTYPKKLKKTGLKIIGEYKGSTTHHDFLCLECGGTFNATPKSKMNNFRKHKLTGCPKCTIVKKHKEKRADNIRKVESKFDILSDWDGRYVTGDNRSYKDKVDITVRNKSCGHIFTTKASNLLSRNVDCPTCNLLEKAKRCNQLNVDKHEKYLETSTEWESYKSKVVILTRKVYEEFKHIINPDNLPRGLAGEDGVYHLDHILPIRYCFDNDIPIEECAVLHNLQLLDWRDNLSKKDKV